ncbi:MAG: type IV pilus modification protein PilV [Oceanospirillaceae bacterium]|nr:type IV pilus modification protein PilV [Oceanospirillaceae bacterium]
MITRRQNQRGATLIEVLVTIVVVSIGLLGMAALQLKSAAVNQSSYQRLQAANLAYEIADSISINQRQARDGNYELARADNVPQNAIVGTAADIDLRRWIASVGNRLPEGDLIIEAPVAIAGAVGTARQYNITICWFDKHIDNIDANCGQNQSSFTFLASSRI